MQVHVILLPVIGGVACDRLLRAGCMLIDTAGGHAPLQRRKDGEEEEVKVETVDAKC